MTSSGCAVRATGGRENLLRLPATFPPLTPPLKRTILCGWMWWYLRC